MRIFDHRSSVRFVRGLTAAALAAAVAMSLAGCGGKSSSSSKEEQAVSHVSVAGSVSEVAAGTGSVAEVTGTVSEVAAGTGAVAGTVSEVAAGTGAVDGTVSESLQSQNAEQADETTAIGKPHENAKNSGTAAAGKDAEAEGETAPEEAGPEGTVTGGVSSVGAVSVGAAASGVTSAEVASEEVISGAAALEDVMSDATSVEDSFAFSLGGTINSIEDPASPEGGSTATGAGGAILPGIGGIITIKPMEKNELSQYIGMAFENIEKEFKGIESTVAVGTRSYNLGDAVGDRTHQVGMSGSESGGVVTKINLYAGDEYKIAGIKAGMDLTAADKAARDAGFAPEGEGSSGLVIYTAPDGLTVTVYSSDGVSVDTVTCEDR